MQARFAAAEAADIDATGEDAEALIARFAAWEADLASHYGEWLAEARECFDFVAGHQDPEGVVDGQYPDGRIHVTYNRTETTIDAVSGAEIMGRQKVTYLPRDVGDTGPNEVLSQGAEWVRDRCDAEDEESEAGRDMWICGVGITETRTHYDDNPDGQIVIERVDPLRVLFDPSARKGNYADARYLRHEQPMSPDAFAEFAAEMGDPDAAPDAASDPEGRRPVVRDRERYRGGEGHEDRDGELSVRRYQWWDSETVYRVANPTTGEVDSFDEDQFAAAQALAQAYGRVLRSVRQRRRVYKQAFVANDALLGGVEVLEVGEFTFKAMTGKRDRNKGVFYGLVRHMRDPQRLSNRFLSQELHMLDTGAKGGVMMEVGAVEDQRQFEDSWAANDKITMVPHGALSGPGGPKIVPKPIAQMPAMLPQLLQLSMNAIRDVTGVNQEMLGMVERQQPGVLEHQRKQAAYGILSPFFASIRRYRKMQGRLLLKMMRFLPEGTLVRVVEQGVQKYVPLAMQSQTAEFDVIVDEAADGPNQKAQTFAMLMQVMPYLQGANLGADVWAELVRYSPLPSAVAEKLAQGIMRGGQGAAAPDPQAAALAQRAAAAAIAEREAGAQHKAAQARNQQAQAEQTAAGTAMGVVQ